MSDTDRFDPIENVPAHVAIIMDGNGRWARARGLHRLAGHRAGTENLREVIRAAVEFGVGTLTIYAFSTENWGRPETEVQGLLNILRLVLEDELPELHAEGVQLRHIGDLSQLPAGIQSRVHHAIELTRENDRLILNVAFNYGGRAEIIHAIRQIMAQGISCDQIDEEMITAHLYTAGQPEPDLLIRTSGEQRLSNFLLWQTAYSEFYFATALWPDFDRGQFYQALQAYSCRKRRFGLLE